MSRLNIPFLLLLLAYMIVASLYALRTPDWQAPDEPAHYNYIAQLATDGCCPVIEIGDWDKPYIDRLTGNRFDPALLDDLDSLQYEDHQPPLYYLLSSVVFRLANGSLLALRLFSVVIGLGVVAAAYAVARMLLPKSLALTAAGFVAFIPQHLAILASVNNDGLSELIVGLTLLVTVCCLRGIAPGWLRWITLLLAAGSAVAAVTGGLGSGGAAQTLFIILTITAILSDLAMWDWLDHGHEWNAETWVLGTMVGVGLLTKINTVFLAGVIPLLIVLRWWARRRPSDIVTIKRQRFRQMLVSLVLFFIPLLLLAGVWWGRNLTVYGTPDFLGLGRHDLVVTDQPRTADQIAVSGVGGYLRGMVEGTFMSFWGQFGWMALPLHNWSYLFIGFSALVVSGWVIRLILTRGRPTPPAEKWRRLAWLLMGLTITLAILQYMYYNTEFYQVQGRYLYPMLIPLGLLVALGLDGWRRLIFGHNERAMWLTVVPVALFVPFNLYLVWRVLPLLAF